MRRKRSRCGRRITVLIRSGGIVEEVRLTGIRPPSGTSLSAVPRSQSMKYSPISDCWRTSQRPSVRSESKPGSVISAVTIVR
jgi:hypothetical protein